MARAALTLRLGGRGYVALDRWYSSKLTYSIIDSPPQPSVCYCFIKVLLSNTYTHSHHMPATFESLKISIAFLRFTIDLF